MLIAEWEDEELLKTWHAKTSLQDQTLSHVLQISDVKSRKLFKTGNTGCIQN